MLWRDSRHQWALRSVDSQKHRAGVPDDERIPEDAFISPEDIEPVAAAATERLRKLGFVGILEMGQDLWDGLSQMLGLELTPVKVNVASTRDSTGMKPTPRFEAAAALDALRLRTAADRILYESVLATRYGLHEGARAYADGAFAHQLERFDDVTDGAATELLQAAAPG